MTWPWYLAAVGLLLLLSALFSGSETALFSLSHARRDRLLDDDPRTSRRVERLLKLPAQTLATILLGNLLVNVTASALLTLAVIDLTAVRGMSTGVFLGVGGLVMTGALLVFGEVTPKVAATRRPEAFARRTGAVLMPFVWLLLPFARLLTRVNALLAPRTAEPDFLSEEELHTMIRVGRERGILVEREEEILWNLVELSDRSVSEVMTPRIDMDCVQRTATIREAMEICRREGRSRLPVYEGTIDNVVGIAYAKELLTAPDPSASVDRTMRLVQFVPEQKKLPALLEDQRKKGSHIAVVVDEFGQTAGLVTLEDVLEAIFGEITDEYDDAHEALPYVRVDDDSYLVEGEIDITTLNRLFRHSFDDVEQERLAAYINERLGRLPEPGEVVPQDGLELIVREMDGRKIEKVLVRRLKAEPAGESEDE